MKHFFFKPPENILTLPHRYQKQADWLTNNFHGICWSFGITDYEKLTQILQDSIKNSDCIYVKGEDKNVGFLNVYLLNTQ